MLELNNKITIQKWVRNQIIRSFPDNHEAIFRANVAVNKTINEIIKKRCKQS